MKVRLLTVAAAALALASPSQLPAEAAVEGVTGTVVRTMADSTRFGNCAVLLSEAPPTLDCPAWVSFSCDGTHMSKADAMRMLDSAQLAFVTGRSVRVWVDDEKKHGTFCVATRIDVFPAPSGTPVRSDG